VAKNGSTFFVQRVWIRWWKALRKSWHSGGNAWFRLAWEICAAWFEKVIDLFQQKQKVKECGSRIYALSNVPERHMKSEETFQVRIEENVGEACFKHNWYRALKRFSLFTNETLFTVVSNRYLRFNQAKLMRLALAVNMDFSRVGGNCWLSLIISAQQFRECVIQGSLGVLLENVLFRKFSIQLKS